MESSYSQIVKYDSFPPLPAGVFKGTSFTICLCCGVEKSRSNLRVINSDTTELVKRTLLIELPDPEQNALCGLALKICIPCRRILEQTMLMKEGVKERLDRLKSNKRCNISPQMTLTPASKLQKLDHDVDPPQYTKPTPRQQLVITKPLSEITSPTTLTPASKFQNQNQMDSHQDIKPTPRPLLIIKPLSETSSSTASTPASIVQKQGQTDPHQDMGPTPRQLLIIKPLSEFSSPTASTPASYLQKQDQTNPHHDIRPTSRWPVITKPVPAILQPPRDKTFSSSTQFAKHILSDKDIRSTIEQQLIHDMECQLVTLHSQDTPSVLYDVQLDADLKDITLEAVDELRTRIPFLYKVLVNASDANHMSVNEMHHLYSVYGILMRSRNTRMNGLQQLVTAACICQQSSNKLLNFLYKLKLSLPDSSRSHFLLRTGVVANPPKRIKKPIGGYQPCRCGDV